MGFDKKRYGFLECSSYFHILMRNLHFESRNDNSIFYLQFYDNRRSFTTFCGHTFFLLILPLPIHVILTIVLNWLKFSTQTQLFIYVNWTVCPSLIHFLCVKTIQEMTLRVRVWGCVINIYIRLSILFNHVSLRRMTMMILKILFIKWN